MKEILASSIPTKLNDKSLFGTKAETLQMLFNRNFPVPEVFFFDAKDWARSPRNVMAQIHERFSAAHKYIAVRSSAFAEDGEDSAMAGAFESVLDVPCHDEKHLKNAIERVIASFKDRSEGQILVQPMVADVQMSGVAMTKVLDDGSPYYVINYDDTSGRTDTITSGIGSHKTVFIYNGVESDDFDSPRLRCVLRLIRELETVFEGCHLDIEFAVDKNNVAYVLQVRRICTVKNWNPVVADGISQRIKHVEAYIENNMRARPGLFGDKTIFAVMPDWNPAEMIGITPRPLASSLYRELIMKDVWRRARERMGYRELPSVELMVSLAGRPYIDVRASFNSFLPAGLDDATGAALVNAWIERLNQHPEYHDKVEFKVVPTILDFDFDKVFCERYSGLLSQKKFEDYKNGLHAITLRALKPQSTLDSAIAKAELLSASNALVEESARLDTPFALISNVSRLLVECLEYGTLPFAVAARHGFIAETLLRSATRMSAISPERVGEFKRSVRTISGEMTADFRAVAEGHMPRKKFIAKCGHLRPGTYDIMTPCYAKRQDLFEQIRLPSGSHALEPFTLTMKESASISKLLRETGFDVTAEDLLVYAGKAIAAREYIKFLFTRHVSTALELLAIWGERLGLGRDMVAMLPIGDITETLVSPLPRSMEEHFKGRIDEHTACFDVSRSFKLSYIIRSPRDVYVVPQHRSAPNYITNKRIEARIYYLDARDAVSGYKLHDAVVCIDGADPGYDWIFSRGIAGLITKYGGSNSHMAIRCAEYGLPAAIGCGELIFDSLLQASQCILDCGGNSITPLGARRCKP